MSKLFVSKPGVLLYADSVTKPFAKLPPNEVVMLLSTKIYESCLLHVLTSSFGVCFVFHNDIDRLLKKL